jgi:hypothetical protein
MCVFFFNLIQLPKFVAINLANNWMKLSLKFNPILLRIMKEKKERKKKNLIKLNFLFFINSSENKLLLFLFIIN